MVAVVAAGLTSRHHVDPRPAQEDNVRN
jgi:hypothetical protein